MDIYSGILHNSSPSFLIKWEKQMHKTTLINSTHSWFVGSWPMMLFLSQYSPMTEFKESLASLLIFGFWECYPNFLVRFCWCGNFDTKQIFWWNKSNTGRKFNPFLLLLIFRDIIVTMPGKKNNDHLPHHSHPPQPILHYLNPTSHY